ncbi:hypothetical protein A9G00_33835 [Achromobacter xylosoxidans]|nr:hypothetical protein A9G00_33835 [Achromobacter xylosoxidans]
MAKPSLSRAARAEILAIAVQQLGLKTLRRRNSDSLDFHELAVQQIRDALEAGYLAGTVDPYRHRD